MIYSAAYRYTAAIRHFHHRIGCFFYYLQPTVQVVRLSEALQAWHTIMV